MAAARPLAADENGWCVRGSLTSACLGLVRPSNRLALEGVPGCQGHGKVAFMQPEAALVCAVGSRRW